MPNTFQILVHGHSVLTQYSKIAFKPNELCTSRASVVCFLTVAQCLVVIIGSLFKCLNSYSSLEEFKHQGKRSETYSKAVVVLFINSAKEVVTVIVCVVLSFDVMFFFLCQAS